MSTRAVDQNNGAIVGTRLHPRCATYDVYLLISIVEQSMVGIDANNLQLTDHNNAT